MRHISTIAVMTSVALAALLSACGGSGSDPKVTAVKVVGASLADSGTFGYKFTVQSGGSTQYSVYSERVAASYRMTSFCPAYTYSVSSAAYSANAGCTNHAVAGAKVNNYDATAAAVVETVPDSLVKQLADVGNAGFTKNDLLIVGEASSNDAAALATAFLTDQLSGGATSQFPALLMTLITPASADPVALGIAYMQALADKLMVAVQNHALVKGAPRVAIVNTLDVTRTPRFIAVLAQVAAANGGGATGDAAAAQVQGMVEAWINAYNQRLADNVGASAYAARLAVVDIHAEFNAQLTTPATYSLTNVSDTVCDEIVTGGTAPGTTSLGTPAVVAACTDTAAAALNLNGTATGWQSYLFADSFHPTPYGHQLLATTVSQVLATKGWD